MGVLGQLNSPVKKAHIGLAVITVLLFLSQVSQLRHETHTTGRVVVSEGFTPSKTQTLDTTSEISVEASREQADTWDLKTRPVPSGDYGNNWDRPAQPDVLLATSSAAAGIPTVMPLNLGPLPLPDEYAYKSTQSDFCIDRFTTRYLEILREGRAEYCSKSSLSSSLTCFHTPEEMHSDGHRDSFCIGQNVRIDADSRQFLLDCISPEDQPAVPLTALHGYWQATGPQYIFHEFLQLNTRNASSTPAPSGIPDQPPTDDLTILVKREGENNPFHSLHEILSLSYTMDVLRMTRDSETGEAYLRYPEYRDKTRIVILDDYPQGPYWDLWQMFSNRPIVRLADFMAESSKESPSALGKLIIPLAGAANPAWHDDWESKGCVNEMRRTFVRRILDFYDIRDERGLLPPRQLTMTIVDRKQTRRLFGLEALVNASRRAYPDVKIQVVDWAALPFKKQVEVARATDILVGIHGAGMTQGLFMKENQGAMIEIMPDTGINCFHAIAMERGLRYFRAHGKVAEKKDDWHNEDVIMEQDKFLLLVDHAVKSLYNRPGRFQDMYIEED